MAHHHHGAYALLLPVLLPLLLLYAALSTVAGLLFFALSRPFPALRRRYTLRKIARQFALLLFIGAWGPELDRVWMPAWRCCCRRTRFRYLHVSDQVTATPPDQGPLEEEVAHLPPRPPGTVRLVLISDTHSKHGVVDVPDGDVLCHTGDILLRSSKGRCCCRDLRGFARFMRGLPHRHKIAIAGNHDRDILGLGPEGVTELFAAPATATSPTAQSLVGGGGVTYLQDGAVTVCGLTFFGTPFSPVSGSPNRAFQVEEHLAAETLRRNCPPGVDVLLTHSCGSTASEQRTGLTSAVAGLAPRIHAYGHYHGEAGVWTMRTSGTGPHHPRRQRVVCVNSAICDNLYRAVNPVTVIDISVGTGGPSSGAS